LVERGRKEGRKNSGETFFIDLTPAAAVAAAAAAAEDPLPAQGLLTQIDPVSHSGYLFFMIGLSL